MAQQMPGELIYEYDGLRITGVTSYGAPPFDAVMSGAVAIPPSGARYDFTLTVTLRKLLSSQDRSAGDRATRSTSPFGKMV